MLSFDTNIAVHAANSGSPLHERARDFLQSVAARRDMAVCELVLVELYLKLRNEKIFSRPLTASQAAAVCLLVARPRRATRKYGDRGLRHVLLEAGAIAQQIALACVALGVGSVDSSSFYDDEVHEALSMDGESESVVHLVILGIPT